MMYLLQVSSGMIQLIFGLLVAFMGGGGLVAWLNKRKTKAETEGIVVSQFTALTKELWINIEELRKDNARCELEHKKTTLELDEMKKHMNYQAKLKGKVFILDDDYDDLHDFKKEFKKISIIDYKGFHDPNEFLETCKIEQPSIVVMDHRLGKVTANEVIDQLGYLPEILIMSGMAAFRKIYEGRQIKFFVKEGNYVFQIAGEVIKYLSNKK